MQMAIDDDVIKGSRLTRNRFLAVTGSTLAAMAVSIWFPREAAEASCYIPNGCHGYCQCSCCSGSHCCRSDCRGGYYGCESGTQCWYTCAYSGSTLLKFKCCDWGTNNGNCICQGYVGPC